MQCAVGTYEGNGVNARAITGVGFQPELVIVKSETTAQWGVFRTASMAGDLTAEFAIARGFFANGIESLDADGFTIGDDARVNENLIDFHWQAFRAVSADDFAYGSYVGNGGDDRDVVTGLPFQPCAVVIKADAIQVGVWKPASLAGDATLYFDGAPALVDRIQALNADGFQVGQNAEVNAAAVTYYWFAFGATTFWITTGNYEGDGNDDRLITGAGFPPALVWVKGDNAQQAVHRPRSLAGDLTLPFIIGATAQANWIQSLDPDGFEVGDNLVVNTNLDDYYYLAIREGTSYWAPVFDTVRRQMVMHTHHGDEAVWDSFLGRFVQHPEVLTAPTYDVQLGGLVLHTHL